jgi:hypothetical protein
MCGAVLSPSPPPFHQLEEWRLQEEERALEIQLNQALTQAEQVCSRASP